MLFNIRNLFYNTTNKYLKIVSENGRFGIKNTDKDKFVIPMEYDNIFIYGTNLFVLYKKGKIGAVRIDNEEPIMVADCIYDVVETFGHDLIFVKDSGTRYYNATTKEIYDFKDILMESPFLYCKDEKYQYILYGELGEIIYKKEYTSYSESCFCFCGNTGKGPVFYDARYSTYLYPIEGGYKTYDQLFDCPIIINRQNVANITAEEDGIGLIDSYGNSILDNSYDSMEVELKITALKGNREETKTISFSKSTLKKEEISDISDWI